MKKNKILLLVNNKSILDKIDNKDVTFLFPLKDFSIGFQNYYKIEDIPEGGYIFVNKIMDNKNIENFKEVLNNISSKIKGIVFDDIGVLNILNNLNINMKKILFLNHFNCNYESINIYLNYVDSVFISPDITFLEVKEILDKALKPLVVYTFGYINIMYSRRNLITNYNKYFKEDAKLHNYLEEINTKQKFIIKEEKEGTVIYPNKPFNGLELRGLENVLFEFINGVFLSDEEIIEIIKAKDNLQDKYPYTYLGKEQTIYKLKGEEND